MSLLVKNAAIISQDEKRSVLRGFDILVEGSRIARVAKGIKEKAEFVVDAKGCFVVPGFVNCHNHAAMTLLRGYADDMELHSWLSAKIWPREAKLKEDDVYWGSLLACVEMIRGGTTCFADMYFFMDGIARAVEESGLRANLSHGMIDLGDKGKREKELREGERVVREWNGKAGGRISTSFGPHAPYTCSRELLEKTLELSKKYGAKIQIHLSETRKEVFDLKKQCGKRPAEFLGELGFLSSEVVASHCCWVSKSEVSLLAKRGVSVVHNPVSNMKLAGGNAMPVQEFFEAGANVALGTDGACSNNSLSMFESMKFAALLQKNARWDAVVLNAQQALDLATRNGAKALGLNAGVIAEGKLADFSILDFSKPSTVPVHNAVSNIVYSASPSNVRDVVVNGKLILLNGKIQMLDEEKILAKAQKVAEDLVSR
ncbi:amidohydrolase family protein [Candidatus Micrarchaeota archaeon]|nr:amidohydrolase family protein [Candidatus Micrarchaeota archaeon]